MGEHVEKVSSIITESDLELYQKLSKFCPIKEDVAQLSNRIELLFNSFGLRITILEEKIDGIQKIVVEQKIVETEVKHMYESLKRLENNQVSLEKKVSSAVNKRDFTLYLTIVTIFVVILAALIPILLK